MHLRLVTKLKLKYTSQNDYDRKCYLCLGTLFFHIEAHINIVAHRKNFPHGKENLRRDLK